MGLVTPGCVCVRVRASVYARVFYSCHLVHLVHLAPEFSTTLLLNSDWLFVTTPTFMGGTSPSKWFLGQSLSQQPQAGSLRPDPGLLPRTHTAVSYSQWNPTCSHCSLLLICYKPLSFS